MLRDTANATVIALDGAPVSASAWSLLPGTHELILRVRIFTDAPNMHYTAWTHCHVYHAAEAGQQYTTRVRIEKKIAGDLGEEVTMHIGVTDADGTMLSKSDSCFEARPRFESPHDSRLGKACAELTPQKRARPARATAPDYPRVARRDRIEGSVDLEMTLDALGYVVDAKTLRATPPGVFDEAALAAVRNWRYCPPTDLEDPDAPPRRTRLEFNLD